MHEVEPNDITFNCPLCQGQLVVEKSGAGVEIPCPKCGKAIVIPGATPATQPEEVPSKPKRMAIVLTPLPSASIKPPPLPVSAPKPTNSVPAAEYAAGKSTSD